MENLKDSKADLKKIELDNNGIEQLVETRKWSYFLSIAGFIFIGLMFIFVIIMITGTGSKLPPFSPAATILPLILILIIYYFPIYYLFQFSKISKEAIAKSDFSLLSAAFKYLKMHYRYMGILFIISVSIYLIAILVMLATKNIF